MHELGPLVEAVSEFAGRAAEKLRKQNRYGLGKIYEMVINNDPCYAYLLEGNSLVDQKLVIAHVCAHNDFFKNNYWFSQTNRKMMDEMANHATRVRRYIDRYGFEEVERFIDVCLSVEDLIDPYSPFMRRTAAEHRHDGPDERDDEVQGAYPSRRPHGGPETEHDARGGEEEKRHAHRTEQRLEIAHGNSYALLCAGARVRARGPGRGPGRPGSGSRGGL